MEQTFKQHWPWFAGGGVVLALLIWYWVSKSADAKDERDREKARKEIGEAKSPEQLASLLYAAMYDNDWAGWTEDEELIMEIGAEIGKQGNWAAVVQAYGTLYKHWWSNKPRNLEEDLRESLSTDEYQRFLRIAAA